MGMSDTLLAIAEPRRREILRLVWQEELAAGEIAASFDVTFGAVSQHLRVLREAGLVEVRRAGRRRFYRARREQLGPLAELLEEMWHGKLSQLKRLAETRESGEGKRGRSRS